MKFKLDFLRVQVQVSFASTVEEADDLAQQFLGIEGNPEEDCDGYAWAYLRRCFIWIGPGCRRSQVFHECYHATHRVLEAIGSGAEDEEVNAHLHEHITEKVLTAWENKDAS